MNKKINRKEILEFIFIFLISLTVISFFSMGYLNEDNLIMLLRRFIISIIIYLKKT